MAYRCTDHWLSVSSAKLSILAVTDVDVAVAITNFAISGVVVLKVAACEGLNVPSVAVGESVIKVKVFSLNEPSPLINALFLLTAFAAAVARLIASDFPSTMG